jgi:thiaminase/transcriptional activator TenA
MSFSNHLRKLAQPVWDAQLTHPFVVALGKGTLAERKFRYYILQDARFLADLARVFAAGSLRAPDSESALRFAKLAEETITVERSLHENYGKRWKLSPHDMLNEPMAPTNYAYTRATCSPSLKVGRPPRSLSWRCPVPGSTAWSANISSRTDRRLPNIPIGTG